MRCCFQLASHQHVRTIKSNLPVFDIRSGWQWRPTRAWERCHWTRSVLPKRWCDGMPLHCGALGGASEAQPWSHSSSLSCHGACELTQHLPACGQVGVDTAPRMTETAQVALAPGQLREGRWHAESGLLLHILLGIVRLAAFRVLRSFPAISRPKSRDIPPKSLVSQGFQRHTELFGPHSFTWKTPTRRYPNQKVWVWVLHDFRSTIAEIESFHYPSPQTLDFVISWWRWTKKTRHDFLKRVQLNSRSPGLLQEREFSGRPPPESRTNLAEKCPKPIMYLAFGTHFRKGRLLSPEEHPSERDMLSCSRLCCEHCHIDRACCRKSKRPSPVRGSSACLSSWCDAAALPTRGPGSDAHQRVPGKTYWANVPSKTDTANHCWESVPRQQRWEQWPSAASWHQRHQCPSAPCKPWMKLGALGGRPGTASRVCPVHHSCHLATMAKTQAFSSEGLLWWPPPIHHVIDPEGSFKDEERQNLKCEAILRLLQLQVDKKNHFVATPLLTKKFCFFFKFFGLKPKTMFNKNIT